MRFEDILNKVKENSNTDLLKEVYLNDMKLENRPSYYEKKLFINLIEWFDVRLVTSMEGEHDSYVLIRDIKKEKEIASLYPNSKTFKITDLIPKEDLKLISDYINIEKYKGSLFRILYRHIYNDKKNFKIIKDEVSDGYIVFTVNELSDESNPLAQIYIANNYKNIIEESISIMKKHSGSTDKELDVIRQALLAKGAKEDLRYSTLASNETKSEIELYRRFLEELDLYILSKNINHNIDKLYIYKNNKCRDNSDKNDVPRISIEYIVNNAIKGTEIAKYLNVDKYVYPCWRIACDHFKNQGMNHHLLEDENDFVKIKLFV